MKKVTLKFMGTGIDNTYQASVRIYNCGNLIYKGKTYGGRLSLCLNNNTAYKVVALLYGRIVRNVFYVNNCDDLYVFSFINNISTNSRTITFHLRDSYYENLPIMKGEMFLWQK